MNDAGFSLCLCDCSTSFVLSNKRGARWECIACGSTDFDNLLEVQGPGREVGGYEFNQRTGHSK